MACQLLKWYTISVSCNTVGPHTAVLPSAWLCRPSHARSSDSGTCADAAALGELSRLLVTLDIELSLYFPLDSFVDPSGKSCTDLLMKSLARCDAIFVPGGDGSTPLHPADLFELTRQLRAAVHAAHNGTKFYVSLQQYVTTPSLIEHS